MPFHEQLHNELLKATMECKKLDQIKKATSELQEICGLLEKEKNLLLIKIKNEEDLNEAEKVVRRSNSERYALLMERLQELILQNDDSPISPGNDLPTITPYYHRS
ncbi:MAG TPA: hypothetical protein VK559_06345 [Ferruginibacter sp.]|nr:hypothetical protein [Ferruginibacter sp.]